VQGRTARRKQPKAQQTQYIIEHEPPPGKQHFEFPVHFARFHERLAGRKKVLTKPVKKLIMTDYVCGYPGILLRE